MLRVNKLITNYIIIRVVFTSTRSLLKKKSWMGIIRHKKEYTVATRWKGLAQNDKLSDVVH